MISTDIQITTPTFITVPGSIPLRKLVEVGHRGGRGHYLYGYISENINDRNFKVSGRDTYSVGVSLIHFHRPFDCAEEVLKEIDQLGFRAVDLVELMEFGEAQPAAQHDRRIFGLGSSWARKGSRHIRFPNLSTDMQRSRRVDLSGYNNPEDFEHTWFAVVRK